MFDPLHLPRVVLRQITHKDAIRLHTILNNRKVAQYNDYTIPLSKQDIKQLIQDDISAFYEGEGIRIAIEHTLLKQLIGTCGLYKITASTKSAYLAFELAPDYWHKGFMSEVLHALLPVLIAKYELNTLFACVNSKNLASCSLLKKLGFSKKVHEDIWYIHTNATYK